MPQYQQQNAARAGRPKLTRSVRRIAKNHAPFSTRYAHNILANQPSTTMRAPHTKVGGCAVTLRAGFFTITIRLASECLDGLEFFQ